MSDELLSPDDTVKALAGTAQFITQEAAANILKGYSRRLLKLVLQKASDEADLLGISPHTGQECLEDSAYVSDSNGPDFIFRVNKQSILELEDEFIKELKL